jgi:hypothetical protein
VAQGTTSSVGENARLGANIVAPAPLSKQSSRSRPYRRLAFLPAFAVKLDKAVVNVLRAQLQGLGDPRARIVKGQKQEKIATPGPGMLVGGCEHRLDLVTRHEAEHPFGSLFLRNGQNALAGGEEI